MNTLGWTGNSGTQLFTIGWIGGGIAGVINAALSAFNVSMRGYNFVEGEPENVFKLARDLNQGSYGVTHSNPAIARIAERLKRGPGGPRFH